MNVATRRKEPALLSKWFVYFSFLPYRTICIGSEPFKFCVSNRLFVNTGVLLIAFNMRLSIVFTTSSFPFSPVRKHEELVRPLESFPSVTLDRFKSFSASSQEFALFFLEEIFKDEKERQDSETQYATTAVSLKVLISSSLSFVLLTASQN